MKKLFRFLTRSWYKLTDKNYYKKLSNATLTYHSIQDCSIGRVGSHFYNIDGDKIRGWHKHYRMSTPRNS